MTEYSTGVIPPTGGALPEPYEQQMAPIELPPGLRKPRLRRWEAAQYLEFAHGIVVATATLAKYATTGGGPEFQKVGRTPLYSKLSLDAWAMAKIGPPQSSTSDI